MNEEDIPFTQRRNLACIDFFAGFDVLRTLGDNHDGYSFEGVGMLVYQLRYDHRERWQISDVTGITKHNWDVYLRSLAFSRPMIMRSSLGREPVVVADADVPAEVRAALEPLRV